MNAFWNILDRIRKPLLLLILVLLPLVILQSFRAKDPYSSQYRVFAAGKKYAHISVLLSENAGFGKTDVFRFRSEMEKELKNNNALESREDVSSYIDCYSRKQTVSVWTGNTVSEFDAYGVGGNFFAFHPLRLVKGSYFSDENVMKDLIVIDEDLAWQLFGSSDVVGMTVMLNDEPFLVSGVVKRETGMYYREAGNARTAIYMSYDAMEKYGKGEAKSLPITNYEVILPDLTKDFAKKLVKQRINVSGEYEIVSVSGRLSYAHLWKNIKKLGTSAMQKEAVVYPYWENQSRAVEEISSVVFLIWILDGLVCLVTGGVGLLSYYRRNRENIRKRYDQGKEMMVDTVKRWKNKRKSRQVDTVIWDLGMVLADFVPEEHFKRKGIPAGKCDALMDAVVKNDIWEEYDRGIMTYEEALQKMIRRRPKLEKEIRTVFGDLKGIVHCNAYTRELISVLKREGYRVLYLSNLSQKLYEDCKEELSFLEEMDGGILSFDVKTKKPDALIYELLIRKYHLVPERCVFFDDREENRKAAGELGIHSILFEKEKLIRQTDEGYDFGKILDFL